MRALVLIAFTFAAVACDREESPPASTPPPRVQAQSAQRALHDCRDTCEQNAIVAHSPDSILRACRDNCDARYGAAAPPPHEVPSRITRGTPTHAPPAVRPR